MASTTVLDRNEKRNSSSCSQYQSDDSAVNARNRSSLPRIARCAWVMAVTSSAIAMYPLGSPAAFDRTVLCHLQMIVSPLLVMFSLMPSAEEEPCCRTRILLVTSERALSGMIRSKGERPMTSALVKPKIRSAAGFQSVIMNDLSRMMQAIGMSSN